MHLTDEEGPTTSTKRQITKVRERLTRIQDDLRRVRANERVLAEQASYLSEVEDDAQMRKLVAQTPLADREWRSAANDANRHRALLEEAQQQAQQLIEERDALLETLFELEAAPRRRNDT